MTVFMRILTFTLLPVMLVILIVISTARTVIQADGIAYAKELTRLSAKQVSDQISAKLDNAAILQNEISARLASIDFTGADAKRLADGLLNTLILSNQNLSFVWFVFEPGVILENERYYKTIIRADEGSVEIPYFNDAMLDTPELSPWYNEPLSTGQIYTNATDVCDYGLGEGFIHVFTRTYPLVSGNGQIIGCMGLDIRYEDLFPLYNLINDEVQRVMLASLGGSILFSTEDEDVGGLLWDYGFRDSQPIIQAMNEKKVWQEEIISPLSGEKLLSCLYPIDVEHTGQTIYLYRDSIASSLYDPLYSSMEVIIFTGMLGMILLTFCVFFSTRSIVGHIKRITESFNNVAHTSAEGTLEGEHIPITQTNVIELDTLQSALVKMMIQLRWAHGHRLKALESEIEKEKLIASAEAKTNFFAAMSHEIRTPMNAIIGIAEIMLCESTLTSAQEKYIRDIKISADSLLNIINDILDISKMETGKMELHPEHYNFKMLMDNIVSLSKHLAAGANLQFIFQTNGELPLCLYNDGIRLRQVLLNLIGNAIKFTNKGYVILCVTPREDSITFSVTDTGVGIGEKEIATIFESFKQIDTRRNREIQGTGLGLSISRNLVELMDGSISVESVLGEGSTFSVTIPLIPGDESRLRQPKPRAEVRYSDSLRVLIVDDDKTNLSVSSGLMKAAYGIRCDIAASGMEAIVKVQETDYDIIFMDHMMPEFDGLDTTQYIRQLGEKYRRIPIIALTANAVIGTRKELIEGGMDDFLSKPLQRDKLREILDVWVPEDKRLPMPYVQETEASKIVMPDSRAMSNPALSAALKNAGIDTAAGMESIGYDEEMYLHSLRLLMERLPQVLNLLESMLDDQNMREFHVYVHGLKGSLISVGASVLSNEARKLEEASLADDVMACRTLLQPLSENLTRLYDSLRSALPDTEIQAGNAPFDEDQLNNGLQNLLEALESCDYEGVTSAMSTVLSMNTDQAGGKSISQLRQLIDSFDYFSAAKLIKGMLDRLENQ